MAGTSHQFQIPAERGSEDVFAAVSEGFGLRDQRSRAVRQTFYDTFDWRLYGRGYVIATESVDRGGELSVYWGETGGTPRAEWATESAPRSADSFTGTPAAELAGIIWPRLLMPMVTLELERHTAAVVNEDDKIVCRIQVDEATVGGADLSARVDLLPLRGYDRETSRVGELLAAAGLRPAVGERIAEAMSMIGRRPGDYSGARTAVRLDPDEPAVDACGRTLLALLDISLRNEPGVREGADTEFLHDFRVSQRRARSLLQRMRGVWPRAMLAPLTDDLRWIGQVSGEVRDLDVYLLDIPRYRKELPASMRDDLAPLADFLGQHHREAHRRLVDALDSDRYRAMIERWRALAEWRGADDEAEVPPLIGDVARAETWRAHKKLLKEGRAITAASPPDALHDLRKTAKKLRYLLESFRKLYPERDIKKLVAQLKQLQDVLGKHQDYHVQALTLARFGKSMLSEGYGGPETLMAMGVLVGHLEERQLAVRDDFADHFDAYDAKAVRTLARKLLSEPPAETTA